jgi:hypothetical protein
LIYINKISWLQKTGYQDPFFGTKFCTLRKGRKGRVLKRSQNRPNKTAGYSMGSEPVMFGRPFACFTGQENKLFPPKKKTNLHRAGWFFSFSSPAA